LTTAAVALLQEASPEIVRRVLRELLSADAPTPAPNVSPDAGVAGNLNKARTVSTAMQPDVSGSPSAPLAASRTARPAKHRRAKRAAKATAKVADPEWSDLKSRILAAMTERGMKYADLGAAIGMTEATVRNGVARTRAPGPSMVAKLSAWLTAPAVAAAATFPKHAANGASAAA
jgi:hypothetical protein